ncbi:MAG: ankyrin repeat domain-containing protein [Pseudohongiellaceae bacterium]
MKTLWRNFLLLAVAVTVTAAAGQGMPTVVAAAKESDLQALRTRLDEGADVNEVYADGTSALHWAAYHDSLDAADLLLDAGANVNAITDLGVTPLWLAAQNGSAVMVETLLESGADPNETLVSGETVVMTAARTGNARVVRQLLAAGANPDGSVTRGQTALMWAAGQGHADVVEALLDHGADFEASTETRRQYVKSEKEQDSHPAYKHWVEEGGNSALLFAARAGDLDSARLLVEAGSDVNAVSAFGTSPVIMAVHSGNVALLDFLLNSGADPDSAASGHTALHDAILRGNPKAVNVLLVHGANPDAVLERATPARRQSDDYHFHDALAGATPLWLAARFSEPVIMQALVDHGADISFVKKVNYPALRDLEPVVVDEGEISILMAAVRMGNRRLRNSWGSAERRAGRSGEDMESLVHAAVGIAVAGGVELDLENAAGQTALDAATALGYESVAGFLIASGARSD